MSKDKPAPLFVIENILFWYGDLSYFLLIVILLFIKIDNFKKSTKSSTKNCNSKTFCILQNVLRNVFFFFFFTNLLQINFLHCWRFCIITKNLNTACTPTEMKQNLLHWIFSRQFSRVIKHQCRHESISQSSKINFFIMKQTNRK